MNWNFFQRQSFKTRVTLTTLAIFMVSLWSLALYGSQMLRQDLENLLASQQFSAASYVASEVNSELKGRIEGLELISRAIDASLINNPTALQKFLDQRFVLHSLFNGGVIAFGLDGIAIAAVPITTGRVGINLMERDSISIALREGRSIVGQPVMGKMLAAPIFHITVAIRNPEGKVLGALSGVTNLGLPNFLDKLSDNSYGKTGGYLLISKGHRLIVAATDKSRFMETLPAPGVIPLIDRFIQGHEGTDVLINPLGVEVLVSAKGVPIANWYVASILPTSEAFVPIKDLQQRMLLATFILTLIAGVLTWWTLRRELSPLMSAAKTLAAMSSSSTPPAPLPISRQDEIGDLIGGFNHLLETLRQREVALRESQAQLIAAQKYARIGSWQLLIGAETAIWSEQVYQILGLPASFEPGPGTLCQIANSEDSPAVIHSLQHSLISGVEHHIEYRIRRYDDGAERWIQCRGMPVIGEDGQLEKLVGFIQDITERKLMEQSLRHTEERFRSLMENTLSIAVQGYAPDGTVTFWNHASEQLYGYTATEALGSNMLDLIIPSEMTHEVKSAMQKMFQDGEPIPTGELLLRRKDGSGVPVFSSHALLNPVGRPPEMFCLDIDLTERKLAEEKLILAASVFSHAREGIMITTADGDIVEVNDAFTRITGYGHDEVLGLKASLLNSGQHDRKFYSVMWRDLIKKGQWYGEVWNMRKNGELFAVMQNITAVRDNKGVTQNYVALFSDITALKEHERQLEHIAHYDALTTLPNRVLLADRLHQAMTQARRRKQRLAVAYLDMDGFKFVNDRHGHEVGDQLLIALAARMKQTLREGDTLARMGGDEFVAVLLDLADIETSLPMLNRLLAAASHQEQIGDLVLQVSASLGVTFYPQAEDMDADQLLRQADQAMYQAKLAGKNRYHIFDAEQDRSVRGHHESIEHIRHALTKNEFVLHYQPKVNMRTGKLIGVEALIRWQHPEKGLLAPGAFLPVIEFHPLAIEVGEWVINTALKQKAIWRTVGLDIPVSVNLSARQLQQTDFVERLRNILSAHPNIQPGDLELEVLETSALEDLTRVSQAIEACRDIGVGFALDDFGTGYSSLTYLKRLPVSQIKIDKSFVHDTFDNPDDLAILEGVIDLAHALRRQVIAEGVETVAQGTVLLQLGCELAQGYVIARPMPAADLPEWAAAWRPDPAWLNYPQDSQT